MPRPARRRQSYSWAELKRIGYSYRLLVRGLERTADRGLLLHSSGGSDGSCSGMAVRPFRQDPRNSRHSLWNQAGRHRSHSSSSLGSWTNSSKDNVPCICGSVLSVLICFRFVSPSLAFAGRWGSVPASSKNFRSVALCTSFHDHLERGSGDSNIVQFEFAISGFLEDRSNRIRQRLCIAGL